MSWKKKMLAALLVGIAILGPACDVGGDGSDVTEELKDVGREAGEAVEEMGEEAEQAVNNIDNDVEVSPTP